ncbi:SNF2 family N-terminal domain-containing protein [Nemania sp. FL0916]|nr:SNF2 family N-terminal domain-containing protein [Nemania sp. FL0916]
MDEPVNPALKRRYPFNAVEDLDESMSPSGCEVNEQYANTRTQENESIIVEVEVQLHDLRHFDRQRLLASSQVQSFGIRHDGEYFSMSLAELIIGRLRKGLCRHLHELTSKQQIYMTAYVLSPDWTKAVNSFSPQRIIRVELNIYGPRAGANEVGRSLSESDIFLQRPQYGFNAGEMEYYNPHILRFEEFSNASLIEESEQSSRTTSTLLEDSKEKEVTLPSLSDELDMVLGSLSHRNIARDISTVANIRSELYPHQKEAVDFVFQREKGQLSTELSLWKYDDTDPAEPFYRHALSGSKRPKPAEITGGIIADEMGLGKSLVVLSTIAGSLDRAEEFIASQSTRKTACRATLIIVPSSLLIDSWISEIREHAFPGSLPFYTYLGSERHKEKQRLQDVVIVFTTFATATADFIRSDGHNLATFNWFRIVIDEAHNIRNRSTKQFQAVASIPALHRWCLTGTPIQNSLDDLGSLVAFLRVPILEKTPAFSRFITKPIHSSPRYRFQNLRTLLQTICIRRTKEILRDLPKPVAEQRRVPFTAAEYTHYRNLIARGRHGIDMATSRRGGKDERSVKLQFILKLRLFCNHGTYNAGLNLGSEGVPADPDEALAYLQQQNQDMCIYCGGVIYSISNVVQNTDGAIMITPCCHLVCHRCLAQHLSGRTHCPQCTSGDTQPLPVISAHSNDTNIDGTGYSASENTLTGGVFPSKLLALWEDIRQNTSHKSIIFSCWKKTLHLFGQLLQRHSIRYNMIHGSMPLPERLKVLTDYRSPMGTNILLMTLGTGAVGLNLALTSRIYLLEPQWNPFIEDQAVARALRLKKTDQLTIIRYTMEDSIEEVNILFSQKRKIALARGGLGNKNREMSPERSQAIDEIFKDPEGGR